MDTGVSDLCPWTNFCLFEHTQDSQVRTLFVCMYVCMYVCRTYLYYTSSHS